MPQEKLTTNRTRQLDTLGEFSQWQPLISSKERSWDGVVVERFRISRVETKEICFTKHIICIVTDGSHTIEQRRYGQLRQETYTSGDIAILPSGFEHIGRGELTEYTAIHLEPSFLERVAHQEIHSTSIEIALHHKLHDPFLTNIGQYLLAEAETTSTCGRLYAESLATAVAVHMLRRYCTNKPAIREYTGGMPKYKLRRVVEFIHDNLTQDLSLVQIAAIVDVNPYHLTRTFKQAMGIPPHQYVMKTRIERAKELLTTSELSIGEIGYSVGFEDQSHFTKVFRRFTSTTPSAYSKNC